MNKDRFQDYLWAYLFVAPTIIGLILLNLWPIAQTFWLSFCEDEGFGRYTFKGIANFQRLLQDEFVIGSIGNTLIFAFMSVFIGIFFALVLANIMSQNIRGKEFYRVVYFLPMIAAPAAVTMVFRMIFNSDFGIINGLLLTIGIDGPAWLSDPQYAMFSMVTIAVWSSLGQQIIILIAAITNVSQTYYEAAKIDGASKVAQLFYITAPLVSPSIFFLSITGLINALRQFDMIYMMYGTETNPALSRVRTIMYEYYRQAFIAKEKGYASAIIVIAFIIILVFTGIQFIAQKKLVYYE